MLWGDPGSPAPQLSTRKTFIGLWGEIQDPHHVRPAFSKQPTPHASGGFTCPAARCWGTALSALMRRWGGGLPGLVGDGERSPSGGEGPTSRPVSRQRSAGVSREGVRYEFNFGAEGSVPGGDALGLHREERRPGSSCRYAARLPERGGAGKRQARVTQKPLVTIAPAQGPRGECRHMGCQPAAMTKTDGPAERRGHRRLYKANGCSPALDWLILCTANIRPNNYGGPCLEQL